MTDTTTTTAVNAATETTAINAAVKPTAVKPTAKKAVKPTAVKPTAKKAAAKKAVKPTAKKAAKKAAKKVVKAAPATERKTSLFSLASKAKVEDMGSGQRAAIAKILKKYGASTRATLIAKLPDVPPANISWHLSMMVGEGTAKKAAQ